MTPWIPAPGAKPRPRPYHCLNCEVGWHSDADVSTCPDCGGRSVPGELPITALCGWRANWPAPAHLTGFNPDR